MRCIDCRGINIHENKHFATLVEFYFQIMSNSELRTRKPKARESGERNKDVPVEDQQPQFGGPMVSFSNQRLWARAVLAACVMAVVYFTSKKPKEDLLASQKTIYERRGQNLQCSQSYVDEISKYKGCVPERCGRIVTDSLVTKVEVDSLLNIAKTGLALGGSDGGASILDLHSGALSHGTNFVNFYKLPQAVGLFLPQDFITYKIVRTKIQHAVAHHFGIDINNLYLTYPTFFSRLTDVPAKTVHDEYWHKHVDKETYESFHYTSLLYLNDYKIDFDGGRFIFINDDNSTAVVEPRKGRVSMFTSGAENPHLVEPVTRGIRYAVTVSFTCDPTKAIIDPKLENK